MNDGSSSKLELGDVLSGFEVGYEALVLVLGYVYSGKVAPLPMEVCECADAECGHMACWPAVDFILQVLFASATFEISELVSLFQRHLLGILDKVDIDDIPVILSVANLCRTACGRLLAECIDVVVNSDLDTVTLEKALPQDIVKQIMVSRTYLWLNETEGTAFPDIHATRIHKALDSDDIELVKLLLDSGHATLDDAYALHHAVAHCDSKITKELLDLKQANVNRKNLRGYSVLHVAAKRKEPEIIMCLLDNGARPYDLTSDGRKAIQISKRLTKAADYYRSIDQGKDAPKDRLCIEILDQAERRPPLGEASNSVAMAANELLQKLLYLEIRVHMAKLLYPMEARVAMINAHVDGTSEFSLAKVLNVPAGKKGPMVLSEIPFVIQEEHLTRLRALSKTVELGMQYFPRCSEVLSRLVDHDASELIDLENNTSEVRRKRYLELQEEIMEAFLQDKKELDGSVLGSASSKSTGRVRGKSAKKC